MEKVIYRHMFTDKYNLFSNVCICKGKESVMETFKIRNSLNPPPQKIIYIKYKSGIYNKRLLEAWYTCKMPSVTWGKQERAAAQGHAQQHTQTSSGHLTQSRGSLGGCNLEKHPLHHCQKWGYGEVMEPLLELSCFFLPKHPVADLLWERPSSPGGDYSGYIMIP